MPIDFLGGKIIIIENHIIYYYIIGENYCIELFIPLLDRTLKNIFLIHTILEMGVSMLGKLFCIRLSVIGT